MTVLKVLLWGAAGAGIIILVCLGALCLWLAAANMCYTPRDRNRYRYSCPSGHKWLGPVPVDGGWIPSCPHCGDKAVEGEYVLL